MEILQGIYPTRVIAKNNLREFVRKYGSCVTRVDYIKQYVKICDLIFYFISREQEETWCKGRTYVYKNELWHSGERVKR